LPLPLPPPLPGALPPPSLRSVALPPKAEITPITQVEVTASGTVRPPAPAAFSGLPFVRPADTGPASAPSPSEPEPATPRPTDRMPSAPPDDARPLTPPPPPPRPAGLDDGIGLAAYAAVKADLWRTEAPAADVLESHGIPEEAFEAYERQQIEAMTREASEGQGERAACVVEALRAAQHRG
jgi:hypothetical protein